MIVSSRTKCAGVMGWPVDHSLSPRLHGFWLEQNRIDGVYIPLPVQPQDLQTAVAGLKASGFCGFNATMPHKEGLLAIADTIDPLARRARAANTVVFRDGETIVMNTDIYGFCENLRQGGFVMPQTETIATVLGAGGAARAIVVGLLEMGFSTVRLLNRDVKKAAKLAEDIQTTSQFEIYGWDQTADALIGADLLVNTTSLGMTGQPPLEIDLSPLPSDAFVTDAVYSPLQTELLAQAKRRGLKFVDGLGMLLYQAQPAFEAWFGVKPKVTHELRTFVLEGR